MDGRLEALLQLVPNEMKEGIEGQPNATEGNSFLC
jgi:hypothetical protein